jgi:DinB superfamily
VGPDRTSSDLAIERRDGSLRTLDSSERKQEKRMNRIDIEIKLHRGRADALEAMAAMSDEERGAPRTLSEHDPESTWSYADHFIHTTLIEKNFNAMIRRHVSGRSGMDPNLVDETGKAMKPLGDLMAYVHAFTEEWKVEHAGKPLDELVNIGLAVRSDTLSLLAELTDEQLASKIPGAPWANGIVGGIMAVHTDHAVMHRQWADEGTAGQ